MTICQALREGLRILKEEQIPDPEWTSERLLSIATKSDRAHLYANLQQVLTRIEQEQFEALLKKRVKHYPLAYLEGSQEFFGREFYVNDSVLIPRPETEEIIRVALALKLPLRPRILDLGAGSGVIPITLSFEIPDSSCFGLELSQPAIRVLSRNSNGRIRIIRGDFDRTPFAKDVFDVITANLPYVEKNEYADLPPETLWEPRLALETQSLEQTFSRLLNESARILRPGGYLIFEIGFGQSDRIKQICADNGGFKFISIKSDPRGVPRVFVLQKHLPISNHLPIPDPPSS